MRVFVYATGHDTGGQGHRIAEAFAAHSDWLVDVLAGAQHKFKYPEIHRKAKDRAVLAKEWYRAADVVHLRNTPDGWERLDGGSGKPVVLHHHGTTFRKNPAKVAAYARTAGMVQIASTIDLTLLEPDVEWLPSPFDVDAVAAMRPERADGPIRIGYFPTNPSLKSAPEFHAAFERLRLSHDVELVSNTVRGRVVANRPWQDVMAAKATCDIYFDQVKLGYGNNAIEAWCMGIPVVAGVADPQVRAAMVERFGVLPWVDATEATIHDALLLLVESEQMRREYGEMGRAHVRRFHDGSVVVPQLQAIYRSAGPTRPQSSRVNTRLMRKAA